LAIQKVKMQTNIENSAMRGFCERIKMKVDTILQDDSGADKEIIYVLQDIDWPQCKQILEELVQRALSC